MMSDNKLAEIIVDAIVDGIEAWKRNDEQEIDAAVQKAVRRVEAITTPSTSGEGKRG